MVIPHADLVAAARLVHRDGMRVALSITRHCDFGLHAAFLLISLPLPSCGRLVLALPSVGLVGALAGAPFVLPLFFLSFFLLSRVAPRLAVCLKVEVGTHFGSRRIAILLEHKRQLDLLPVSSKSYLKGCANSANIVQDI